MPKRNRDRIRVEVEGLPELIHGMGVMEENYRKAEQVFERLSAQAIVSKAKAKARGVGRQQAKAAETAKVFRGNTAQYGGTAWAFGAEFGALVFKQFPAWRGKGIGAGYFFWPAVEDFKQGGMMDLWDQTVWKEIQEQWSKGG